MHNTCEEGAGGGRAGEGARRRGGGKERGAREGVEEGRGRVGSGVENGGQNEPQTHHQVAVNKAGPIRLLLTRFLLQYPN